MPSAEFTGQRNPTIISITVVFLNEISARGFTKRYQHKWNEIKFNYQRNSTVKQTLLLTGFWEEGFQFVMEKIWIILANDFWPAA